MDKNPGEGRQPAAEPGWITPAAEARRVLRGSPVDAWRDAPVSGVYLDQLRALGVEPGVASRWLNAVSAPLTPEQVDAVSRLPFVAGLRAVASAAPTSALAPAPVVVAAPVVDIRHRYQLDYGASITQLERVNAVPVLEAGGSGAGVRLGIIDTGLGSRLETHPMAAAMVADGRFGGSQDFTGQAADASTHGFAVMSVAAGYDPGQLIGPAYGATVFHARTEYAPTETNQEEDNLVAGLEWMEAQGVDVVNISLGYSVFDAGQQSYVYADMDGDTGITTVAADLAAERGMVVVNAAGNEGCGAPSQCWYYITTPADGHNVIAVGAVDATGTPTTFSSRGPTVDGRIKPDVAAMGASVYLASGAGYGTSNGTSFASPMVAGIVALLLEANPALTPADVADILRATASQSGSPDNGRGYGIVDAEAAVQAALDRVGTGVEDGLPARRFTLEPPFPNPVTDRASVGIHVEGGPLPVRLLVYNSLGQEISRPFEGTLPAGLTRVDLQIGQQPPGLYLYRLETPDGIASGRLIKM